MHPTEGAGRGEDHDVTRVERVHRFAVTVKANVPALGWDVHLVLVLLTQSLEAPVELALHDVGHGHDLGRPVCQGNRKGIAGRSRSPTATADQRDLGGVVVLSMNDGKGNSREGRRRLRFCRNFRGIFCERERVESMAMFLGFGLWFGMGMSSKEEGGRNGFQSFMKNYFWEMQ